MSARVTNHVPMTAAGVRFYRGAIDVLECAGVSFLVGGAFALRHYTGIFRHTKDFDVFILPDDCPRALAAFAGAGFRTELTFPHWLGKAFAPGGYFIDLIFSSGNGLAQVDAGWFKHAVAADVLGKPVRFCPVEEMIWSKGFIMERERFDGADVAHLLLAEADRLDWPRLLGRFGPHYRVLLVHLILYGYIYPAERHRIPSDVLDSLLDRLADESAHSPPADPICRGTILSRTQYLVDIQEGGMRDARLLPDGEMSPRAVAIWTAAIEPNDRPHTG